MGSSTLTLDSLDAVLGPVAARHRSSTPPALGLALLGSGLRAGVEPALVRSWVHDRLAGTRPNSVLITLDSLWDSLVHQAQSRAQLGPITSATPTSPIALGIAGRLVAGLAQDVGGGVGVVTAKATTAIIGLCALTNFQPGGSGIDSPLITHGQVGVALGVSRFAAGRAVRSALEFGLVRQVGSRAGSAQAYKLTHHEFSSIVDQVTIRALASLDQTSPVVQTLLVVHHPWTGYGPVNGVRLWAWLMAQALEIEPGRLGLSTRAVRLAQVDADHYELNNLAHLLDRLDVLGHQPLDHDGQLTAVMLADQAELDRQTQAAARKTAVQEARARADRTRTEKAQAQEAQSRAEQQAWATSHQVQGPLPKGFNPAVHMDRLRTVLLNGGQLGASEPMELHGVDTDRGVWFGIPVRATDFF